MCIFTTLYSVSMLTCLNNATENQSQNAGANGITRTIPIKNRINYAISNESHTSG